MGQRMLQLPKWLKIGYVGLLLGAAGSDSALGDMLNLGPAGEFNVFVFNDNTQHGSDAHGKVAVGGNATFGQYTVASRMGTDTDNLIVGGNYSNSGTKLNGGMVVNGDVTWHNPSVTGRVSVNGNATFTGGGSVGGQVDVLGTYTAPHYFPANTNTGASTALPFDFAEVQNYLTQTSDYLASIASNGTTSIFYDQVHLTANSPLSSFVSFDVTAEQLAAAAGHGLSITAPAGSTVVVNVLGAMASFESMGITLNGVDKQHVLYNFSDATNLTIESIGVLGTILAPRADVDFVSGNIDGTMIANNLTGNGESHLFLFEGNLPAPAPIPAAVPEPSSWILLACVLSGGLMVHTIRRNRARSPAAIPLH